MISYIQTILGNAPHGLEFFEYIFGGFFLFVGVYIVYETLSNFFRKIL